MVFGKAVSAQNTSEQTSQTIKTDDIQTNDNKNFQNNVLKTIHSGSARIVNI